MVIFWVGIVIPNMPPYNWAYLMNLVFHLKKPDKKSRICEDEQDIWLFSCQGYSNRISVTKSIYWLDNKVIINNYCIVIYVL